ncbi:uncharacterized protein BDV14DRAFT_195468 [Aspergillus stella-maris]|uniref:uncharacterized protein n=1 Tax=Aspergillus stella-maris TaxID=1810926 RepID=UPI003CCCE1CD
MNLIFLSGLLGLPFAPALSVRRRDNTQPSGTNPVTISQAEYLGEQTGSNSCTHRDLGFTGEFAGDWYALYGDTLYCESGVSSPDEDTSTAFNGMVRDALARLGNDPLSIEWTALNGDEPVRHPTQFIPYDESYGETSSTGFGGTSICSVNDTTAMVFYLVNQNDEGLKGVGIAKVELQNNQPVVTQRFGETGYWWDSNTTPRYGDIAAYRDKKSEYIYAWGGPPNTQTEYAASQYVYQVRVKADDAFDLSKYEYWWGREQGWKQGQPLTEFTSDTAVMWSVGQGQVVYSEYYQVYLFVHFAGSDVAIRTAPAPEGPWSDDVAFYTPITYEGGMVYAACAHPYLDESGKTLTISYTNANHIQVIKATFQ